MRVCAIEETRYIKSPLYTLSPHSQTTLFHYCGKKNWTPFFPKVKPPRQTCTTLGLILGLPSSEIEVKLKPIFYFMYIYKLLFTYSPCRHTAVQVTRADSTSPGGLHYSKSVDRVGRGHMAKYWTGGRKAAGKISDIC